MTLSKFAGVGLTQAENGAFQLPEYNWNEEEEQSIEEELKHGKQSK